MGGVWGGKQMMWWKLDLWKIERVHPMVMIRERRKRVRECRAVMGLRKRGARVGRGRRGRRKVRER